MTPKYETDERLETPKQLAKRVGISERQIRHLLQTGKLDHIMIGCRVHIPDGAFRRFLDSRMVNSCPDETREPEYGGSRNGVAIRQSAAAAASARPGTSKSRREAVTGKARSTFPHQAEIPTDNEAALLASAQRVRHDSQWQFAAQKPR